MVRKIQISVSNKSFYSLIVIGVLILVGFAVAYNSGSPSVMGHSIDEIEGMDNYYTKGEVYSKSEVDAMLSVIETGGTGGTGCPVGYTLYEQSSEAAKCYKDGEVILATGFGYNGNLRFDCMGRIVNGVLQSRAKHQIYGGGSFSDSGWINGASTAVGYTDFGHEVVAYCFVDWSGISGYSQDRTYTSTRVDLVPVGFGNILQIK